MTVARIKRQQEEQEAVRPGSWLLAPDSWRRENQGFSRLLLQHYRNYEDLDFFLDGCLVVLTGPNGAGKTNILEALSFLSPGRGLRGVKLSQVTNLRSQSSAAWVVAATLETQTGPVHLGTSLEYTAAGTERRFVKINGQLAKSQASLTDWVNVIWVTPQLDRLFLEGASARRKFVDRLVYALDPGHAGRVHRYEHHLRERAHLLKEGRYDPLWVSTLERHLAEDGVAITVARQAVVKNLEQAQSQEKAYPFPQFQAQMEGTLETGLENRPALAVEDDYVTHLKANRCQDGQIGGASLGPHRSDFQVHHLAKQLPAALCSTGEQKMLLLAVTLAFTRVQTQQRLCPTILLLDDVAAHLDDQHRLVLFQEICSLPQGIFQVWMTGTDESFFHDLNGQAQFLAVHQATLTNGFY
jgi:DNA replication and repair protein RecF